MAGIRVRDDFYTVDKREPIRKVQGTLQGDREDIPILVDEGRPFGVVNERGMVQSRIDLGEKLADYAVGTKLLSPDASLDEAVRVALTSGLRWVPVADEGDAVGYVTAQDLLLSVLEEEKGGDVTAWELGKEVPVLGEDRTLGEAIRAFREEAGVVHVLPVADSEGRVSGALSRRAVIQAQEKAGTQDRPMHKTTPGEQPGPQDSRSDWPVEGLADGHYATLDPDDGPGAVAETIDDFGFAFVTEDRVPQGVVTDITALRALRG